MHRENVPAGVQSDIRITYIAHDVKSKKECETETRFESLFFYSVIHKQYNVSLISTSSGVNIVWITSLAEDFWTPNAEVSFKHIAEKSLSDNELLAYGLFLVWEIEQNKEIYKQISSLNVSGTKLIKNMELLNLKLGE